MGLPQIGKLRHDSRLLWLYKGEYSSRSRPRKYDGAAQTKDDLQAWQHVTKLEKDGTEVYEGIVCSRAFKRQVKVVILRNNESKKQRQALLFSTDLSLLALTIVDYYRLRFQIEFLFRDAKQHTDLGDCQARKALAVENGANASVTALNLLKFEDRRKSQTRSQTVVISIESWQRRKANQQLMNLIFDTLEINRDDIKVLQAYRELSNFGCISA